MLIWATVLAGVSSSSLPSRIRRVMGSPQSRHRGSTRISWPRKSQLIARLSRPRRARKRRSGRSRDATNWAAPSPWPRAAKRGPRQAERQDQPRAPRSVERIRCSRISSWPPG